MNILFFGHFNFKTKGIQEEVTNITTHGPFFVVTAVCFLFLSAVFVLVDLLCCFGF